ncbi:MAG: DUF2520 domain-containing protein [Robiginitalea sp.]|uniref:Rossmann-like and DUF2520 domain-containing protein n=1 Tax=Robiginitalea sp. TaxID=1902411 RepID=UPI003C733EAD
MIRVVLIGSGNLAYHLHKALLGAEDVSLVGLVARRPEALSDFETTLPIKKLGTPLDTADVYILAVADSAIGEVMMHYPGADGLFVHTSGAMDLKVLQGASRPGVLYPLQTFSKERAIDFQKVPLCIEAALASDAALLTALARTLSTQVLELPTAKRRALHLAAVYINNFSNHMIYLGETICSEAGLSKSLLGPLLDETCAKAKDLSAYSAQTGPARRNDTETLQAHLRMLTGEEDKELYTKISESIYRTYEQEL